METEQPKRIYTLKEYLEAPKSRRQNKIGWYREPDGYLWLGFNKCASHDFEEYWKKHYPIQYFLREIIWSNINIYFYRFRRSILHNIKCFFFPRQRWLTKVIPNDWMDKPNLIDLVLFTSLEDFIEKEKGFETVEWYDDPDIDTTKLSLHQLKTREAAAELKRAYRWCKITKKIEERLGRKKNPCWRLLIDIQERGNEKYAKIIFKYRHYLWT